MLPPGTLTATAVRQRPSELTVPRLSPPAPRTPDRLEQACPICEPVEIAGMQSEILQTGQPSERPDHRPVVRRVDERLSSGPLLDAL